MPISKTKRFINVVIYVALFIFIMNYADGAFDHLNRAGNAVENLRSR